MPSMSYCQFQNTLLAMQQCINALDADGVASLSNDELDAAEAMIEKCEQFLAYKPEILQTSRTIVCRNCDGEFDFDQVGPRGLCGGCDRKGSCSNCGAEVPATDQDEYGQCSTCREEVAAACEGANLDMLKEAF